MVGATGTLTANRHGNSIRLARRKRSGYYLFMIVPRDRHLIPLETTNGDPALRN